MALAAATVWEIRTTGNDNNGGGFVTGASGTDYSQQDAAQANGTNLTVHASTNTDVLPDGTTPAAAHVGNLIQITAGAGFTTGWYEIKSIQSGYWRLDRSPAATSTSGGTWYLGGAIASPGNLGKAWNATGSNTSGQRAYMKTGTYTLTSSSANVAGGTLYFPSNTELMLYGYQTTRGDFGTPPTIDVGAYTSINIVRVRGCSAAYGQFVVNVKVDGNDNSGIKGFYSDSAYYAGGFVKCTALDCATGFHNPAGGQSLYVSCYAESCATYGFDVIGHSFYCRAKSCAIGFRATGPYCVFAQCVADASTTSGFDDGSQFALSYVNCTAYGTTGGPGFKLDTYDFGTHVINCVSVGNSTYGFKMHATGSTNSLQWSAAQGNTSGAHTTITGLQLPIADPVIDLSGDPFTSSTDFRPDNTTGEGASLRAAAVAVAEQTNNTDIGAVQHADPAAGGASPRFGDRTGGLR